VEVAPGEPVDRQSEVRRLQVAVEDEDSPVAMSGSVRSPLMNASTFRPVSRSTAAQASARVSGRVRTPCINVTTTLPW
jgi:hypothetical protein